MGVIKSKKKRTERRALPALDEASSGSFAYYEKLGFLTEHEQSIGCHEKKAHKEEGKRKHKRNTGDIGAGNVHAQHVSDEQEHVNPIKCHEKKAQETKKKHKRKTGDSVAGNGHVQQGSDKQVKEDFLMKTAKKTSRRKGKRKTGDDTSCNVPEQCEDKKEHEKNTSKKTERMKHKRKKVNEGAANAHQQYEGDIKEKAKKSRKSRRLGSDAHVEERGDYFCLSAAGIVAEISEFDRDCTREMRKAKKGRKSNTHNSNVCAEEWKGDSSLTVVQKVDEISGVGEDCSRGMKKWLLEYKQSRPGLKILQERIDKFIADHEANEEQEKKEREAQAAEGGWTVVVHHKGRKKTTDSESGIAVGSVNQAAVLEKMAKKKSTELLDFYRFQKREARMNELMTLQAKFEHDKKRIQQLRAERKFRPY